MSSRVQSATSFFSLLPDIELQFPQPRHMGLAVARSTGVTRYEYVSRLLGRETSLKSLNVCGKGFTAEQAVASLVGETAERLALFEPERSGLRYFTLDQLSRTDSEYLSPFDLVRDHRAVLNPRFLRSPDRETASNRTEFAFVGGKHLVSGKDSWLPAGDVYLSGRRSLENQDMVDYRSTTNGAAAHSAPALATTRALLELLERNDVVRTWLCLDHGLRFRDVSKFETLAADIYIGRANTLTSDFSDYSTAVAAYVSDSEPRFHIAAAADFDYDRATVRALSEVLQGTQFMSFMWKDSTRKRQLDSIEAVIFNPGRVDFYTKLPLGWNSFYYSTNAGYARVQRDLDRLFDFAHVSRRFTPNQVKPFVMDVLQKPAPPPATDLSRMRDMFAKANLDPVVVDVTGRFAALGLSIQKAVTLDLLPLPLRAPPPLQHPSFADCTSLNPLPHPFA
jgi:hypothetical protein